MGESKGEENVDLAAHAERSLSTLRTKLLDLKRSNPLLNLRLGRSQVRVVDEVPEFLFTGLLAEKAFSFIALNKPDDDQSHAEVAQAMGLATSFDLPANSSAPEKKHSDDRIQTLLFPHELEKALEGLRRKTNTYLQELGVPTLYFACGFLDWYESDSSEVANFAPLLLLPIQLKRDLKGAQYVFTAQLTPGSECQSNETLRLKLKRDFQYEVPEFGEQQLAEYLAAVEKSIEPYKRWRVRRQMILCTLRFERLLMWKDLGANDGQWNPTQHPVLKRLMAAADNEPERPQADPDFDSREFDETGPQLVTDADSSQTMAVVDALAGRNLVVRGPPGTGKSQTITNMIAAAIGAGRRVLFVAEKSAALDVVRKRLEDAGLGEFALELHSTSAAKRTVMDQIQRRTKLKKTHAPARLNERLSELRGKRDLTSQYMRALSQVFGSLGLTLQQLIWRVESARAARALPSSLLDVRIPDVETLTLPQLNREQQELQTLCRLHQQVCGPDEDSNRPWQPFVSKADIAVADAQTTQARMSEWNAALIGLNRCARDLRPNTPPTLQRIAEVLGTATKLAMPRRLFSFIDVVNDPRLAGSVTPVASALAQFNEASSLLTRVTDDAAALARTYSALDPFQRAIARISREDLTLQESQVALVKAGKRASALSQAASRVRRVLALIGFSSLSLSTEAVAGVVVLITELRRSERDALLERSKESTAEKPAGLVKALESEIEAIRDRITSHDAILSGWRSVQADQFQSAASTLRITGWWGRLFSREYKSAHAMMVKLTRGNISDRMALATQAEEVALTLESMARLERDPRLRTIGIRDFDWETTNIGLFVELDNWAKRVRNATPGEFLGRVVRRTLFELELETLDTIQTILSDDAVRSLSEWDSTEFCGDLEASAAEQAEVSQSGLQSLESIREAGVRSEARLNEIAEAARSIEQASAASSSLSNHQPLVEALREDWGAIVAQPSLLRDAINWTRGAQAIWQDLGLYWAEGNRWSEWSENVGSRMDALRKAQEIEQRARDAAQRAALDAVADPNQDLEVLAKLTARAVASSSQLHIWLEYLRALQGVRANVRLSAVQRALDDDDDLSGHYPTLVYRELIRQAARHHPQLESGDWSGETLNAARQRFAELDLEVLSSQRDLIKSKLLTYQPPSGNHTGPRGSWTEMALIDNECGKQTRHIPVRDLVNRAKGALSTLFPCFMMSPLSVAQYLPRTQGMFDILIIDEASQMRPEDAAGAVLRAQQLVAVGDERQLPPSSFFDSTDDEEADSEAVESILDWSQSVFRDRRELLWHYRSRHESLISFSNHNFYDGRLIVFPSPNSPVGRGVSLHPVEGRYLKSLNQIEAERIVESVLSFMKAEPNRSLGVVAMNAPQKELIETLLDERIMTSRDDSYRERWSETLTPFFVKNLESVQGDERDAMFVSLTYGPSPQGEVFQRFGPINGAHGSRRLNVLFTRAREELRVFSSLKPSDIKVTPSSREGVRVLRDYLEFAHSGGQLLTVDAGNRAKEHESPFEEVVSAFLTQMGFEPELQVGVQGFFIDMGLRHPDFQGGFVCGVECDGASFHSMRSARDRDRLRQTVLERLGWRIIRVWSTDWFRSPDRARAKLREEVLEALRIRVNQPRKPSVPPPDNAPSLVAQVVRVAAQEEAALQPSPPQPPPTAPKQRPTVKRDLLSEAIFSRLPDNLRNCPTCGQLLVLTKEDKPFLRCSKTNCSRTRVEPPFEVVRSALESFGLKCQCGETLRLVQDPYRFPGCPDYRNCEGSNSWAHVRARLAI